MFDRLPNHAYIGFFSCRAFNCVERVLFCVNSPDRFFARYAPLCSRVPNMGDMFVSTLAIRLVNACYLEFTHDWVNLSIFSIEFLKETLRISHNKFKRGLD